VRVVVVGAGVGGLALARGLISHEHEVLVVEEAASLRLSGAAVSIWSNGAAALKGLGISLDSAGRRIDRLQVRSATGRLFFDVDATRLSVRFGVNSVTLPRRRLLEELANGLPERTIRFGARCRMIHDSGSEPAVELTNGALLECDAVVGADGHHSVVRRAVGEDRTAESTGWVSWQGLTPVAIPLSDGNESVYIVGKQSACGLMPAGDDLLQWWFDVRWPPPGKGSTSVLDWLKEHFGSWASPVPELLGSVSEDELECFPHVHHRVPRSFSRGRVAIIGDAVHAMPPSLAQGANQTLEEAFILSREFERSTDPATAFAAYQRLRRRRVRLTSLTSKRMLAQNIDGLTGVVALARPPVRMATSIYGLFLRNISNCLD
jgi:2-polyprenyl-6-methoxyphenol hydroxylase-like FAD-dependent oxidoreductase